MKCIVLILIFFKSNLLFQFYRDSGIEVRDFGPSWRDGVAFLAIIDAIKANLVNLEQMRAASNRQRLETAFDVAENQLGIARLLDAEDVDVDKPDEKSIMTYVAQFLHKYPEPKVVLCIILFIFQYCIKLFFLIFELRLQLIIDNFF